MAGSSEAAATAPRDGVEDVIDATLQLDISDAASEDDEVAGTENTASKGKKKKKKKKPKSKKQIACTPYLGKIPGEEPPPKPETPEEAARWSKELSRGAKTYNLPSWGLLNERTRPVLDIFLTSSCRRFELLTPRLKLRQVEFGDTTGIRRIKMEPIVQKTQLYGSPSISDIKDSFQNRYIRSSIPRTVAPGISAGSFRDEYVFAISALDPSTIDVKPPGQIRISNRISSAEGYLGNIALHLESSKNIPALAPQKGKIYMQPTFPELKEAGLAGRMFYEIHPQLWGQGLMSEAFAEVLRFAMEEVGCTKVISDPTTINDASIRLCVKNGLIYTQTVNNNAYGRPQLFHEITKEQWWSRNRPGVAITDHWGGKEVCRWCMNFRLAPPVIHCPCGWARYCSRECQKADWLVTGGHQAECDAQT